MRGLNRYFLSCPGALLIGILQGLWVWADDIAVMYRAAGSSLNLTVNYPGKLTLVKWNFNKKIFAAYTPKESLSVLADDAVIVYRPTGGSLDLSLNYTKESEIWAEWKFYGETFAEYTSLHQYSYKTSQFSGRLKEKQDQVGITVQNLQYNDGGKFLIIAEVSQQQQPTKTIKVFIENPITDVQIEKNETWTESTNSCVINLNCKALGTERSSYRWSGYKNESGAQMQFTLSPVGGAVTMNCTATNNVSTKSASERVTCYTDQTQTGASLSVLKLISSAVAAFPYLLSTFILLLKCYRARAEADEEDRDRQHAVIEDKASC